TVDGTGTLSLNQFTSLTDGGIYIDGGTYALPNLTDVDGSNLEVYGGGSLTLSGVTSYDPNLNSSNGYWSASGSGGTLSLPNLTTISTNAAVGSFGISSQSGGQVAIGQVATINLAGDSVNINSFGTGSLVDLSGVTSATFASSSFSALAGGAISYDATAANLQFSNTSIAVDNPANFPLDLVTSLTNSTLNVEGGTFAPASLTTLDGTTLNVSGGGTLTLAGVTSFDPLNNDRYYAQISVDGVGSLLSLPNLTSISSSTSGSVDFSATGGGDLELPLVATMALSNSSVNIAAYGTNSVVDLAALSSFTYSNADLSALQGGAITLDTASSSLQFSNARISVDNPANFPLDRVVSLTNSTLNVAGGTFAPASLTTLDGTSVYVSSGAALTLAGVATFDPTPSNQYTNFNVDGAGSVLSLPNLTTISTATYYGSLDLSATNGGSIDLSGTTTISLSSDNFSASATGSNSLIDLSALSSISTSNASFTALGGGAISLNTPSPTLSFSSATISIDNPANFPLDRFTSLTDSTLNIEGGTFAPTLLTDIDGTSINVTRGGSLTLAGVATYAVPSNYNYGVATLGVDGSGSLLSLPALASISAAGYYGSSQFSATNGGEINLPVLATLDTANSSVGMNVSATGTNSVVEMPALTTFTTTGGSLTALSGGAITLNASLTSLDSVTISVDNPANFPLDQFTSLTNSSLNVEGNTFQPALLTDIDGTNFYVTNGASLTLSAAKSWAITENTLAASGANSVLSLPLLKSTTTSSTVYYHDLTIEAEAGGLVSLPLLAGLNFTGSYDSMSVSASGANSVVATPDLAKFAGGPYAVSDLSALQGGTITLAATLTSLNKTSVTIDGASVFPIGQFTSITGAALNIEGGTFALPNLTVVDGSSLVVTNGASLTLAGVTSYDLLGDSGREFSADGAGALLSLPNLTKFASSADYGSFTFSATNGGHVGVAAITSLDTAAQLTSVSATADGANSVVDLSGVTTFSTRNATISMTNGGVVLLGAGLTTLNGVTIVLDANSTLPFSSYTAITNGGITVNGGTWSSKNLTDVDGSSLTVNGGSLTLPNVTSYANTTSYQDTYFQTYGSTSVLSLPNLTTLGKLNSYLHIQAQQGGQTDLPVLTGVNSTGSAPQYLQVYADGSGSSIDLSSMTSDNAAYGYFQVTSQATVLDPLLTSFTNVNVTLDGTGTLATSQWASLTGGSLTISGGTYALSNLTDFDGSSATVNGGTLSLPGVVTYQNSTGYHDTYFQTYGSTSVLSLPNLTTLGILESYLHLQAQYGGQTELPVLTGVNSTSSRVQYLQVYADGSGSSIDLSSMTSDNAAYGYFQVTSQATVLDPLLTSFTNVNVTLDGTGTLATSQWASLTGGSLTISGGTYTLSNLTDFDGSSATVNGGTLSLPGVVTYQNSTGYHDTYFQTYGSTSVL
ncbi:MAG: hypothetical protein KGM43_06665, partial [Planctomycetota bacterium]|nr:hypothetical protein [Planctomycetota bacterium]